MEEEGTVIDSGTDQVDSDYSSLSIEEYQEKVLQNQAELIQKQDDSLQKQDELFQKIEESLVNQEDVKKQNDEVITLLTDIKKGIEEKNEQSTTVEVSDTENDYVSKIYEQQTMQSWVLFLTMGLIFGYIAIRGVFDNWRT